MLAGALVVVTMGAYVFSTFCWEYCEPEDEPTFWDGAKFALPFALVAVGLMTAAVAVWTSGRGPWLRALGGGIGLCLLVGVVFAAGVATLA